MINKPTIIIAALVLSTSFIDSAWARSGRGGSVGSRGATRSFTAPAPTVLTPRPVAPLQAPTQKPNPAPLGNNNQQAGRFGFGGGLLAGIIGGGLLAGLLGGGFAGGGLLPLLIIIAGGALLYSLWRKRQASASFPSTSTTTNADAHPINLLDADYQAFEHCLKRLQTAYSALDRSELHNVATSEVADRLLADLDADQAAGRHDSISNVQLLQGELSEAWHERGVDYATVAMRFTLVNVLLERATGKVLEGDPHEPQTVTELWTFRREPGRPWQVSAIQQG